MASSQSIGKAIINTVVTTVATYFLGGLTFGAWSGPGALASASGGALLGGVVSAIDIGYQVSFNHQAASACKEQFERCMACQKN